MDPKGPTADERLAATAASQHGVVAVRQLLACGLTREQVKRRVARGSLHREYRGVYRVGHRAPSVEARYMAAVLACGDKAFLGGAAAAFLLGLVKRAPPVPSVTTASDRRIPGIEVRRVRRLDRTETWRYRGIPMLTVAAVLVELAGLLTLDDLGRACHEAEVRHRTRPAAIAAALALRPNARGAAKLLRVIDGDSPLLLSVMERQFRRLLRAQNLPLPLTNRPAGSHYVDCRWPDDQLTVELDSFRFHHSRHAWEQDRRRAREARARGDEFRRYTYRDVCEDPTLMLKELRGLLAR